jgi:hypothetical protein
MTRSLLSDKEKYRGVHLMIVERNSERGQESDLAMERGGTSCEVKPRTRNRNMNATVIQVNHGTRTCCIFHKGELVHGR